MKDLERLKNIAREIRIDILKMLTLAGSGHTGGSLSAVEILVFLYFYWMKYNPQNPLMKDRDRFVLSKGHAAPLLYAVLAKAGFFPKSYLDQLRRYQSPLQGHPDMHKTPGVEISSGSLGQGLSVGNGMALACRLDKLNSRVYVLLGDGETQEGQIWEAAMTAAHYKIDNLCAIIDYNDLQIDGFVHDIMGIEPIMEKWQAFGWNTLWIDGHDFHQIRNALSKAEKVKNMPTMIIAKTIKGKGVSKFENKAKYHGVSPTEEELEVALEELKAK
ncbi:transketolase [bacterium]|nr:transketolase [bacterium]